MPNQDNRKADIIIILLILECVKGLIAVRGDYMGAIAYGKKSGLIEKAILTKAEENNCMIGWVLGHSKKQKQKIARWDLCTIDEQRCRILQSRADEAARTRRHEEAAQPLRAHHFQDKTEAETWEEAAIRWGACTGKVRTPHAERGQHLRRRGT